MFGNIGHLKKLGDMILIFFSSNKGMLKKCWGTLGMLKSVGETLGDIGFCTTRDIKKQLGTTIKCNSKPKELNFVDIY